MLFFCCFFGQRKIIVDPPPPFLTPKAAKVHSCTTVSNERTNVKRVRFFIFDGLTMLIFRGAEGVHRLSNKTTSTTQFPSISSCPEKETLWRERGEKKQEHFHRSRRQHYKTPTVRSHLKTRLIAANAAALRKLRIDLLRCCSFRVLGKVTARSFQLTLKKK